MVPCHWYLPSSLGVAGNTSGARLPLWLSRSRQDLWWPERRCPRRKPHTARGFPFAQRPGIDPGAPPLLQGQAPLERTRTFPPGNLDDSHSDKLLSMHLVHSLSTNWIIILYFRQDRRHAPAAWDCSTPFSALGLAKRPAWEIPPN